MSRIIFLDIDGVLVPAGDNLPMCPVFDPNCVKAMRSILWAFPSAKVVFATTWRLTHYVNQLHAQWLENGFSESLAIDGTPDLRGDPDTPRLHQRGLEIRAWLNAHPSTRRWVVIDDERLAIEKIIDPSRCVFTRPRMGLTPEDAERAVRILGGLDDSSMVTPPAQSLSSWRN